MLSRIAIANGWKPGSLFNENFSYAVWYPYFRNYLLNKDAVFTTLCNVKPLMEKFFIRPLADDKEFTGHVTTLQDLQRWQNGIMANIPVLYASPQKIGQEYRHFIVDGKVISSSRYKLAGKANFSNMVDDAIVKFAERMAAIWSPAQAFVLDTYVTGEEMGIVELGCICHAGFYQADVQKIIMALNNMIIP